jgi:hypothetical protein
MARRRDMTGSILYKMLKENTGRAMLDSGGDPEYDAEGKYIGSKHGYGRAFERNAKRDFEKEPEAKLEFSVYGEGAKANLTIDFAVNVYHWLKARLSYRAGFQRQFEKFAARKENEDTGWLGLAQAWVEKLPEVTGLYGDKNPLTVNTYNGEDALSQTIQYILFEFKDVYYVALQIHGGCDARGGYTKPRIFEVTCDDPAGFLDNARGSIYCDGEGIGKDQTTLKGMHPDERYHAWDTEDAGYRWRPASGSTREKNLEECEFTQEENGESWTPGKIHVLKDHTAHCPKCGGKLSAGPFPV